MPEYAGGKRDVLPKALPSLGQIEAFPWWLTVIVILGALAMARGGLIALLQPSILVSPHDAINGAAHIYAGYFASRALVLAPMLLVALLMRARGFSIA